MRDCGFSRVSKEGEGGPGVGPLAPVDVWRGQDVHIDVAGRGRKKLPQGIAVPPSVHKAEDCPHGEHRHDKFDYCHPEKRKHRGAPKPKVEKPYFVVEYNHSLREKREWQQVYRAAYQAIYRAEEEGGDMQEAIRIRDEAYEAYRAASDRVWELKREVMKWRKEQRPETGMLQRYNVLRVLRRKESVGSERYRAIHEEMEEIEQKKQAMDIAKKEKRLPQEARRMLEVAQEVVKFPLSIEHLTMGGRQAASYTDATKTIAISPRVLKMLKNFRATSSEGGELSRFDRKRMAEFTSILLHEVLHSANPIGMKLYKEGSVAQTLEEGLTDWSAWYLARRFASAVIGEDFDWEEAVGTSPPEEKRPVHTKYGRWVRGVAGLAVLAGGGDEKAKPYYITKWKFYTKPEERPKVMSEDMTRALVLKHTGVKATVEQMNKLLPKTLERYGILVRGYQAKATPREVFETEKEDLLNAVKPPEDDSELLPWQKRLRARAWEKGRWSEQWGERPEEKPFQRAVRKVRNSLWRVSGFEFKGDKYPPETPAPTGGGGSGPAAGPGALVPAGMDVRHTGTPPKGVGWTKFPRQGGESVGGTGAGAVEAMETTKHLPGEHDQETHSGDEPMRMSFEDFALRYWVEQEGKLLTLKNPLGHTVAKVPVDPNQSVATQHGELLREGYEMFFDSETELEKACMEKHDTPASEHCEHDPRADCAGFASGEEAGGRTKEEEHARVMDWLERHEVPQNEEGRYQFYHATPKTALGGIRREGLKAGSLLETDPESAAHFAARDRELKPHQVAVLPVDVLPHEIRVGMWAALRVPHKLEKSCKVC